MVDQNADVNGSHDQPLQHIVEIRVQYHETDAQGRVHHAEYLNYFEHSRVELLRSMGYSYRDLEASGLRLVVTKMEVDYFYPAEFDDLLSLTCVVAYSRGARAEHHYHLTKEDGTRVVNGRSEIACIDVNNKVSRLPEFMQISARRKRTPS